MDFNFLHNSDYIPTCLKDYCLIQQLGHGAFGVVFKAIPLKGKLKNENLALKIINKTKLTSQAHRRRIINEIFIHSSLGRHKNILNFYTSFEDHQNVYIVTQLCSQGSLYSFIQTQSSLPLKENIVKKLMKEIVSGLIFLHSHKIIHRDLKLSNILLDENNIAKIADFGLSIILQDFSDEEPMTLCGTPNYISPEIITHKPTGLASDIWSLGCIFFCLLDNSPPFQSENISETLTQIINGNLRQLPSHISYEAKSLVNKMLQKNPSDRIKTQEILKHPFFTSISSSKKNFYLNTHCKLKKNSIFPSNLRELETITDISKSIKHTCNLTISRSNQHFQKSEKKSNKIIVTKTPLNTIDHITKKPFTTYYSQNDIKTYENHENFNLLHTIENKLNSISEDWIVNAPKEKKKNPICNVDFCKDYFNSDNEYMEIHPISYLTNFQESLCKPIGSNRESVSEAFFMSNINNEQEIPIKYNTKNIKNLNVFLENETIPKHNLYEKNLNFHQNDKNNPIVFISDFAKKYHFNTKGLNTIKQKTKHANLEITKQGHLKLSFHNMNWECLISSDGIKVKIIQNNILPQVYQLDDLPAKYLKAYHYASKFISILKSKIPKLVFNTSYTKCRLYLNSVFEIHYLDNPSIIIQLDSKKHIIKIIAQNNSESKNKVLYEGDIESAYKKFPKIISDVISHYKKCLNLGKDSDDNISNTYAKFINGKGWWWINKKVGIMMFLDGSQLQVYFKPNNNYLNKRQITHIKFINNIIHEIYEFNDKTIPEIVKKKLLILKNYKLL
ncbi:hypothetical protein PCANB_000869 [Pneumocystis canis]|nr:hypothetical protein PCANB_000869 [Pneumocystis canis]